jgi:hypothetical protein
MRDRHNDQVKQLTKAIAKRDKALDALIRAEAKVRSQIKAVARSQKRLDKARSLAALNAGPTVATAEPLDLGSITPEQATDRLIAHVDKVIASKPHPLDIPAELRREPQTFADCVPGPKPPKRKSRRTPEDFRNDVATKR